VARGNGNVIWKIISLRASLGTPFFLEISIFPREISSFSQGKMEFPN
jgi:hypothetical protein